MAATLVTRFPEKAPELFAYQASIVRAERNYEPGRWVSYDRQFRHEALARRDLNWSVPDPRLYSEAFTGGREALARRDLNWSVPDPRLYSEAFTGRARAIPRCQFCLQDDHTEPYCPRNTDRPWLNWFPDIPSPRPQQPPGLPPRTGPPTRQRPLAEQCRRFNEGRCRPARCHYTHACRDCRGPHPAVSCVPTQALTSGRSRSPMGGNTLPQPPQRWPHPCT